MRRTNTKERILEESLKLFSTFGYNAVGVEMIAAAVKVTPPSLYKHFKGKREILDTIIDQAEENYLAHCLPMANYTDEEYKLEPLLAGLRTSASSMAKRWRNSI